MSALHKRPNDCFISYSHADQAKVQYIVNWLQKYAGLKLWWDYLHANSSKRTTEIIEKSILSSRGVIFFLSENWAKSTWCRDEFDFALIERRRDNEFVILALQIDHCSIPNWFQLSNVIQFQNFSSKACFECLKALTTNKPSRLDSYFDVYLSKPWSNPREITEKIYHAIHSFGWRLVGDARNNLHYKDSRSRIKSIINSVRGFIAILEFEPSTEPYHASKWIIDEVNIACESGKPMLVLIEKGVQLEKTLLEYLNKPNILKVTYDDNDLWDANYAMSKLEENINQNEYNDSQTYSFLAMSLLKDIEALEQVALTIEFSSNMNCVQGIRMDGLNVQQAIIKSIQNAAFVIADVSEDNKNSLIEAGIARGSNTPLHLICKKPEDGNYKKRFMFEDLEMSWYSDNMERLAIVYRIARKYQRRIYLNENSV